jgi:hypothetical protein
LQFPLALYPTGRRAHHSKGSALKDKDQEEEPRELKRRDDKAIINTTKDVTNGDKKRQTKAKHTHEIRQDKTTASQYRTTARQDKKKNKAITRHDETRQDTPSLLQQKPSFVSNTMYSPSTTIPLLILLSPACSPFSISAGNVCGENSSQDELK